MTKKAKEKFDPSQLHSDERAPSIWNKPIFNRLIAVVLVASVFIFGALAAMVILALRPTHVQPLADNTPLLNVNQRQPTDPKDDGCGLNQEAADPGCAPITNTPFKESDIDFAPSTTRGPKSLLGTLSVPELNGKRPAVVLIAGSGPTPRDAEMPGDLVSKLTPPMAVMKAMAAHLAQQGFVVLRFDKRTCAPCYKDVGYEPPFEEYLRGFSFLDLKSDAEAAFEYLKTHPSVDKNNIVLVGHSQGASFIPAMKNVHEARALVWLAGFSGTFEKAVLTQLSTFADIRGAQKDLLGRYLARASAEEMKKCFEDLKAPDFDKDALCLGGGVRQGALAEYNLFSAQTKEKLKTLKNPLFMFQGNVDRNIEPHTLVDLQSLSLHDAEMHIVRGVNHALVNVLEPGPPTLSPKMLDLLDGFMASVKSAAP